MNGTRRPVAIRRCWLFLPGADGDALSAGPESGADVLIQELEDFVAPDRREAARALCRPVLTAWKAAGALAAVRVNPLRGDGVGEADLEFAMAAAPDIVLLPKVDEPERVVALDRAVEAWEARLGLPLGSTELVPNIESARGVMRTYAIARASPRVTACLMASEDLAEDLGAERGRDGAELSHARARFHLECTAAGVVSIDCPYTWRDRKGLIADTKRARRLGYVAKSAVVPAHAAEINRLLTPNPGEVATARETVAAFEAARRVGAGTLAAGGKNVELPTYLSARRVLRRAAALGVATVAGEGESNAGAAD